MRVYQLLLFCSLHFLSAALYANNTKPVIEKEPAWITVTTVNYRQTHLDNEAEDGYADLNYEQQVSLEHNAVFFKKVVHILSEAGVQNQSQLSVDYDPAYESIAFHSIKIIRDGAVIDQLNLSRIKTIQQEKELNRYLYDGTLTAVLFLEDVRKDDIIEYSYTRKGFNPIFKNKYAGSFVTRFGVPLYQLFYKLVVPKNRNVTIKNKLTQVQPSISATATATQYEWSLKNTDALRLDNDLPSWYDAYPAIILSEFSSWKEVADWAVELFPFGQAAPLLQKKAADIKATYSSLPDQVLAALHFVQDDVRYMGIEMGENSHKPHLPVQVITQRFGDCKDKVYLLCSLLRLLGVQAYPVLNNTDYKKIIATWLPSPLSFDHTTVCAVVEGKTYWFDATISYQRGALENISYPDYQVGLVARPGTTDLTTIPLQEKGKMMVKEIFRAKDKFGAVQLQVITMASGSYADNTRYSFKNSSNKELQREYKNFYSSYFKKIDADSLSYVEDNETGSFTTTEYYTIHDFWSKEDGKTRVLIEPYLLNGVIKQPKEEKRSMPFLLTYPAVYEEDIEVHLPEDWPIQEADHQFNGPGFSLSYEYSKLSSDAIVLKYRYQAKADHITAEETPDYLATVQEANKSLAFEVFDDHESSVYPVSSYSNKGFTVAYVVLGILAFATYLFKRNRQQNSW